MSRSTALKRKTPSTRLPLNSGKAAEECHHELESGRKQQHRPVAGAGSPGQRSGDRTSAIAQFAVGKMPVLAATFRNEDERRRGGVFGRTALQHLDQ